MIKSEEYVDLKLNMNITDKQIINGEELFECDCKLGANDTPCYQQFDCKQIIEHRIDYQSCDYWDEDCYNLLNERIIAIMSVLIDSSSQSRNNTNKDRKRRAKTSTKFLWRGLTVCKAFFLYVHAIKKPKWSYLKKRYFKYGVEPRQHQNKIKPVNNNAIKGEERQTIVGFIRDYAQQNARNPDSINNSILLSSDDSVKSIYRLFNENLAERKISYETFRNVWKTYCANIKFEAKTDKLLVIEFIKSYAKQHFSSEQTRGNTTSMILSSEHNVKMVYTAFKERYDTDVSYDVFNHTWKTCCSNIKFENSSHYNRRKCSHCGVDGHTNRKIGDHFLCPIREQESAIGVKVIKKCRN